MTQPAVFLDRDGVINRALVRDGKPYPPASLLELEILPGVPQALRALRANGYRLVTVTNQPDAAISAARKESVEEINARLLEELELDAILTCFHGNADGCECRKPRPGLLLQAARSFAIDLPSSFMIGDRWRDMEAGRAAGCRTVFIDYRYQERQPQDFDFRAASLREAAHTILAQAGSP